LGDYEIPATLRFTQDDEWVRVAGNRVTIGISDFAQQQLGDVVFIELPAIGKTFEKGDPFGVIESVKAVADLYAPVTGEIVEVNADLMERPESVNEDCYGDGWMIIVELSATSELDSLLSPEDYTASVAARESND
jgi:glycine cleavage system H protein